MGYRIALHYNSSAGPAEEAASEFRQKGAQVELFPWDLARPDVSELIQAVTERFEDLNVLVNSASVYDQADIRGTDAELFDRQMNVNLRAPYLLTRAFAEHAGGGNVVNIVDNKIAYNQNKYAAYLLSKKSLAEFTRLAALEFAPAIRVNGIAPGVVLPAEGRSAEYIAWREQGIPLKRKGSPDNLNRALKFILENDFVTGQVLMIDGGESLTNTGLNAASFPGKADT